MQDYKTRRKADLQARKDAGHEVPHAGTLNEISYCKLCGAGFTSHKKCPKKRSRTK